VNRSKAIIFSHQQFGDEECAEQKKDRNAEVAEKADVVEPVVLRPMDRHVIHAMHGKDA
jgi:hypothetical protein